MPNTIRQKIERFHHFDQSPWRRTVVRSFLVGDPIPGLTERPPGEGVNGGPGYSPAMKTLAHLFAVFYAYQYKSGYGGLTPEDIDELSDSGIGGSPAGMCEASFLMSITAEARGAGETGTVDLSDYPELRGQFRDLLTNEAKAQEERHRFGHGVVTQAYRDMRDAELDLRRGIGGPPRRGPGRPPEPEDVRKAKERARAEQKAKEKEKAREERTRRREEPTDVRLARERAQVEAVAEGLRARQRAKLKRARDKAAAQAAELDRQIAALDAPRLTASEPEAA